MVHLRLIASAFTLACAFALALAGCVAEMSGQTSVPSLALPGACGAAAPACVASCSAPSTLAAATCEDGVFRCERGVRLDLCCDPIENPERCAEWGDACDAGAPCSEGYTCVTSRSWPLPDAHGICRLGDWQIPEALAQCQPLDVTAPAVMVALGQTAAKVEGTVSVVPTCDGRRCDANNPCCQRCTGAYRLDMIDREAAVRIGLRTETLSCAGTNCGFSCSPLQPGRRYRLWGLWQPDSGASAPGSLYVAGFCGL